MNAGFAGAAVVVAAALLLAPGALAEGGDESQATGPAVSAMGEGAVPPRAALAPTVPGRTDTDGAGPITATPRHRLLPWFWAGIGAVLVGLLVGSLIARGAPQPDPGNFGDYRLP